MLRSTDPAIMWKCSRWPTEFYCLHICCRSCLRRQKFLFRLNDTTINLLNRMKGIKRKSCPTKKFQRYFIASNLLCAGSKTVFDRWFPWKVYYYYVFFFSGFVSKRVHNSLVFGFRVSAHFLGPTLVRNG